MIGENNFNQNNEYNIINKQTFESKIKNKLKERNTKKIVIIATIVVVAIIALIISLALISNDNTSDILRKNSWKDLMINIDGNTIKMGDKMSSLVEKGFNSTSENYKLNLDQSFTTGVMPFTYKESNGQYNTILFSAYNPSTEPTPVSECVINRVELTNDFYKNYNVVLPEGLILTNELTITKITKKWGEPTYKGDNLYEWLDENKLIRISTNEDGSILSIMYSS